MKALIVLLEINGKEIERKEIITKTAYPKAEIKETEDVFVEVAQRAHAEDRNKKFEIHCYIWHQLFHIIYIPAA